MSRLTAPLLSFGASGQIAKTQVYSSWKGRPYVRRYVVPSNPQSAGQTATRTTFSWLNNVWKFMPAAATAAWDIYASNNRFTNRNGFIKQNLSALIGEADLTNFIASPSVNGGLVAATMTFTPGNDQITFAGTASDLPAGWTVEALHGLAIRQQDPQTGILYQASYVTDATDPYSVIMAGLASAQTYFCAGWFSYIVSPTKTAYGLPTTGTALTT